MQCGSCFISSAFQHFYFSKLGDSNLVQSISKRHSVRSHENLPSQSLKMAYRLVFLLLYVIVLFSSSSSALLSGDVRWTHEYILDKGFEVRWDADDPDFLVMEMSGPTMGWVGFGLSPNEDMEGSDLVIGYVDSLGVPHVKDFHGVGKEGSIVEDPQQDYFLIAAAERDDQTTIRFHRRWETCDETNDIIIGTDTLKLIWAWHTDDPKPNSSLHWTETRGSLHAHMRLPSKPLPFPDGTSGFEQPPKDVKVWDLTLANVDIDVTLNSLFMCKLFKFPFGPGNHQLIGFRPLITDENEGNIHRISLYRCPDPFNNVTLNQKMKISEDTVECNPAEYTQTSKEGAYSCTELVLFWALGSEGDMLPSHVGIPFVEADKSSTHSIRQQHHQRVSRHDNVYFKLEVHYDNLAGKQLLDSSGIRVFLTDKSRLFPGGTMQIGHRVSPFLAVPPSQDNFNIYSLCSSDCTRNGFPESGINIFAVVLHSHESVRKMRLRHIRDGKELHPIAEDGNYTYVYQQSRVLKQEARVFPGDELILDCSFGTLDRDEFTFGGFTNKEETCQAFLYYYPKVSLTLCESQPELQSFLAGFGVRNATGDGLMRLDQHAQGGLSLSPSYALEVWPRPADTNPFETISILSPKTLSNGSMATRMMKSFDWKQKLVAKKLENYQKTGKYQVYCKGIKYRKYVTGISKFERLKKTHNSICRRRNHHRHSGGEKTETALILIAFAFFAKVIISLNNYSVN